MLLVAEPAIAAVDIAEAVFGGMAVLLEQLHLFGFNVRKILRVHALAPEVRILEVFVRAIADQTLDILADEGRRVVAARLEAVDYGRRGFEQKRKTGL